MMLYYAASFLGDTSISRPGMAGRSRELSSFLAARITYTARSDCAGRVAFRRGYSDPSENSGCFKI